LRRHREYYVGGRPRRRLARGALMGIAILSVVLLTGAAAMSGYMPAVRSAPVSAAPTALPSPTAAAAPSETQDLPTVPTPSLAPPCRPPASVQPARVVSHGNIHEKVVALTFDDGTNPENTRQILRILQKEKVNATFFPTGRSLERFPDTWRAIAKANYPIANHTYLHDGLAGLCFEPQRDALARASAVFDRLGIPEYPVMRPPFELFDETTTAAATAEGFDAVILWNIDTQDWQGASARTIQRIALSGGRGAIVLMHTFPEATAAALPGIIKGYKARGFRFVTIGQLLGMDGPVPFPAANG
jgi:peptidoglycan/xylan/chitin deacetylase (PgdA/CDA1 family)